MFLTRRGLRPSPDLTGERHGKDSDTKGNKKETEYNDSKISGENADVGKPDKISARLF